MALALEDFKKSVGAAIIAGSLAFTPATAGANDDVQHASNTTAPAATSKYDSVAARDAMDAYSLDSKIQGIGVFINLQAIAEGKGDRFGKRFKEIFASYESNNKPISSEYRFNQSRGTATEITIYVKGVAYTCTLGEFKEMLPKVIDAHQGAWLPERLAMNQLTR